MGRKKLSSLLLSFVLVCHILPVPAWGQAIETKEALLTNMEALLSVMEAEYYGGIHWQSVYEGAMNGSLEGLDPYSRFISANELQEGNGENNSQKGVGFGISYVEIVYSGETALLVKEVYSDSAAKKAGIVRGDMITQLNGESPKTTIPQVATMTQGVQVTIIRDALPINLTVTPATYTVDAVFGYLASEWFEEADLPENHKEIGVIYIDTFEGDINIPKQFVDVVTELKNQGVSKLILDLRYNGGGRLVDTLDVAKVLLPKGYEVVIRDQKGKEEKITGSTTVVGKALSNTKPPFDDMVVLINEYTASAAELLASILQGKGYTVVGKQSFGKGVGQGAFPVKGTDDIAYITAIEIFPVANGKKVKIDGVGVIPTITTTYVDINKETITKIEWTEILNDLGYGGDYATGLAAFNLDLELKESDQLSQTGEMLLKMLYEVYITQETKESVLALTYISESNK